MHGRGAGRKDHTLLRDEQLNESLLGNNETGEKPKESASILRLLALAKHEVLVRLTFHSFLFAYCSYVLHRGDKTDKISLQSLIWEWTKLHENRPRCGRRCNGDKYCADTTSLSGSSEFSDL